MNVMKVMMKKVMMTKMKEMNEESNEVVDSFERSKKCDFNGIGKSKEFERVFHQLGPSFTSEPCWSVVSFAREHLILSYTCF